MRLLCNQYPLKASNRNNDLLDERKIVMYLSRDYSVNNPIWNIIKFRKSVKRKVNE